MLKLVDNHKNLVQRSYFFIKIEIVAFISHSPADNSYNVPSL